MAVFRNSQNIGAYSVTAGEALSQYAVVYCNTSDGNYYNALSNGTSVQSDASGIVSQVGGIAQNATGNIVTNGLITNNAWTWTPGGPLYVGSTAGTLTQTAPTGSGYFVKPLGFAVTATQIWFFPQTGWDSDSASVAGGATPEYIPPSIKYSSSTQIVVPKGRYYKAGYRCRGQYQDVTRMGSYWDVASNLTATISGTYAAGSSSGVVGGKVNSSWYSVFLVGNDANSVMLLPFIRVKTIAYSSPSTTINPGDHNTGASNDNGFVTGANIFQNYRLMNITFDTYDGNLYTIASCTDATPDTVVITGDITAQVAAAGWLQMIPPSGTACIYLGSVRFDGSGNLTNFIKTNWLTKYRSRLSITVSSSTSPQNAELIGVPPVASSMIAQLYLNTQGSGAWAKGYFYDGSSGSTTMDEFIQGPASTYNCLSTAITIALSSVAKIRYQFCSESGGTTYTIATCSLDALGFIE
jgi:hypothetical protein